MKLVEIQISNQWYTIVNTLQITILNIVVLLCSYWEIRDTDKFLVTQRINDQKMNSIFLY